MKDQTKQQLQRELWRNRWEGIHRRLERTGSLLQIVESYQVDGEATRASERLREAFEETRVLMIALTAMAGDVHAAGRKEARKEAADPRYPSRRHS